MRFKCGHQRASGYGLFTATDERVQGFVQPAFDPLDIHCHSRDAVIVDVRQYRRQASVFACRRISLVRSPVVRVLSRSSPDKWCSLGESVFIIYHDILFFNSM